MTTQPLSEFLESRFPELLRHLWEHVYLTGGAVTIAAAVAIPLGVWIHRHPGWQRWVLAAASVTQTIPSLALLAFLLPVLGIGWKPAVTALVLYSMLPILRGTVTGLDEVPADAREAGIGIGMSRGQLLRWVELPLALPSLVNGLRVACIWSVGTATIATYISAGGLGDFIARGLAISDNRLILLGAIPAALLAITLDWGIGRLQKSLQPWK